MKHNNHPRRPSARRKSLVHELLEGRRLLTTITSVGPLPNSHVEPPTATISATFDTEIDPDSISVESFAVHGTQTGPVVRPRTVIGGDVRVSPEPSFHAGELVQVTATGDIMDVGGEPATDSFVWQFRAATSDSTGFFGNDGRSLGQGNSYDVSVGDIDGDGDLDAVVANYNWLGYEGAKVWINAGNGTFTDSHQALGSGGTAVELGDLDGDGDLDAVVESRSNQVWINDGTGTFQPSHHQLGGRIHEMALGDVDDDGDLDMIVSPGNSIWINNGNATFEESGQNLGTFRSVALGDLDNDGDLDALLGGNKSSQDGSSRADQLWLNDGNGQFRTSGQSLASSDSSDMVLGDVDGDGDLDALVQSRYDRNTLWLNDGDAWLSDSGQTHGLGERTLDGATALGDVDADGDLDAIFGQGLWLNDGNGNFRDTTQKHDGTALVFGDLDGDGDMDTFAARIGSNKVRLNDGNGGFREVGQTLDAQHEFFDDEIRYGDVAIGDLDNDGDLDAFVGSMGSYDDTLNGGRGRDRVWLNNGDGEFSDSGQELPPSASRAIALGDVDGDGDLDAFVGNGKTTIGRGRYTYDDLIWLNNGDGQYTESVTLGDSRTVDVALADLDGDGDLDAISASDEHSSLWSNDGHGNFSERQSLPGGGKVTVGDIDNDGDFDVLIAAYERTAVFVNDGNGMFSTDQLNVIPGGDSIALGDVDSDGDLDVFVANSDGPNGLWLNDGHASFFDSGQMIGDSHSLSVELGDIDGDGDLDAFVVNRFDRGTVNRDKDTVTPMRGRNKVWLNDGNGKFVDSGQSSDNLGTSGFGNVSLGDLDGDGDLDAIIDNRRDLKVLVNQNRTPGDANRDGVFNSSDLVVVFQANEYEDGVPNNSTFSEGDWNGDGDFNSSDLVFAFQLGDYVAEAKPLGFAATVDSIFASADRKPKESQRVLFDPTKDTALR